MECLSWICNAQCSTFIRNDKIITRKGWYF